jgi:hypothetical protein
MLSEELPTVGSLCSTTITPLPRSYGPLRPPLLFNRFPGDAGYTAYLAPLVSQREEEGFSSCLARPRHRAAAPTPPEDHTVSASVRYGLLPSPFRLQARPPGRSLSGPPLRSLALRPGDSRSCCHDTVDELQVIGFPPPCHLATGRLAFALAGLSPAERASLSWTHNRTCPFRVIRLKQTTCFTVHCSFAVNLLVAVQVYKLQVAIGIFSPILFWFDMMGVQFFPIEEAFPACFTDIFLILGNTLFTGREVFDIGLVPLLPVYPQIRIVWGVSARNQGVSFYVEPGKLEKKSSRVLVTKHPVIFSRQVHPSPVPFLFPVPGFI